jgi:hypothetical protein
MHGGTCHATQSLWQLSRPIRIKGVGEETYQNSILVCNCACRTEQHYISRMHYCQDASRNEVEDEWKIVASYDTTLYELNMPLWPEVDKIG